MKLFFYCQKIGFLKIYSSIIREAINRNHLVEVCFDQIESDTYEIKKRFTDNYLNSKNLEFKILKTNNELVDYLALNKDIDIYILIYPRKFLVDKKLINKVDNKVVFIMSGIDTVGTYMHWHLMYKKNSLDRHSYKKYLFTWTDSFFNELISIVNTYGNTAEKKNMQYLNVTNLVNIPVGFSEIDNNIKNYDKNIIKNEFNLETDRDILIYLPYPISFDRPNKSWQSSYSGIFLKNKKNKKRNFFLNTLISTIKYVFIIFFILINPTSIYWSIKGYNEKNMIKSIRKFCDKNKILFVIKRRKKHRLINEAYNSADLIIDDSNNVYPSNYQKLLRISKLVMGYHSTAVFEAVKMDVPYLNIESPTGHFPSRIIEKLFSTKKNYFLNFPGVVWNHKIKYLLSNFHNMKIEDFELIDKQKNEYIKKFLNKRNNSFDTLFNNLEKIENENSK